MTGLERYIKKMRLAIVLEEMDQVVPWEKLCWLIEPCYPSWPMGAGRKNRSRCCGSAAVVQADGSSGGTGGV